MGRLGRTQHKRSQGWSQVGEREDDKRQPVLIGKSMRGEACVTRVNLALIREWQVATGNGMIQGSLSHETEDRVRRGSRGRTGEEILGPSKERED